MKLCKYCDKQLVGRQKSFCSRHCNAMSNKRTHDQKGSNNHMWAGQIISKYEIERLYFKELKSFREIAELKNSTIAVIRKRFIDYGFKARTRKEAVDLIDPSLRCQRDPNSKKGNRKIYIELAKKFKKWQCERCGATKTNNHFDLIVHHKDENNFNNDINNLMILCQSCHAYIHGKKNNNLKNGRKKNIK